MYKKDETYDMFAKNIISKLDILRENGNDEDCMAIYKKIINDTKSDSLDVIENTPFANILIVKIVSFVCKKIKHYDNFRILGENAPTFLEYLIDNYKRVLKGVEITTENMNYDNICNLIRQKAESDSFLANFSSYIGECIDSKDFSAPNYNYHIALEESRAKVLELDSMYNEEKTKKMHN